MKTKFTNSYLGKRVKRVTWQGVTAEEFLNMVNPTGKTFVRLDNLVRVI